MGKVLTVKKVNNIATETEQRPKGPTTYPNHVQLFLKGRVCIRREKLNSVILYFMSHYTLKQGSLDS